MLPDVKLLPEQGSSEYPCFLPQVYDRVLQIVDEHMHLTPEVQHTRYSKILTVPLPPGTHEEISTIIQEIAA